MENCILKVNHLVKSYGEQETKMLAVNDISFSVNKGDFIVITGASGSGKSTLLHMIGCVEQTTSGVILLEDRDITNLSWNESAILRRQKISIIYQNYNLIPVLTVRENIVLPLQLKGEKVNEHFFQKIVERLGIADKLNNLPNQLSGGQQQRVAIGRALMIRPTMILADEPTGNLDSQSSESVIALLKQFNEEEAQTIILVTHDMALTHIGNRIIELKDGKIFHDEVLR